MNTKEAKESFEYANGKLYWKTGNTKNKEAGCLHPTGYIQVKWKYKTWRLHRIVWIWHGNKLITSTELKLIIELKI